MHSKYLALLRFQSQEGGRMHYAIRSHNDVRANNANLKSWLIGISENGEEWIEIDRRESNADLEVTYVTGRSKYKERADAGS
jgi:hypothetical protein